MKICLNCKKEFESDSKFCDNCGTKLSIVVIEEPDSIEEQIDIIAEESASTETFTVSKVESNETKLNDDEKQQNIQITDDSTVAKTDSENIIEIKNECKDNVEIKKKHRPKKALAIISSIVSVVLILSLVLSIFIEKPQDYSFAFYFKDKELFLSDLKTQNLEQLTSKLYDGDEDVDNADFLNYQYDMSLYIQISEDGNRVFYPDKYIGDYEINLYYRDLKEDAVGVKIDSYITSYAISPDGNKVVYKKSDGALYINNLKENKKDKISSDVSWFYTNYECTAVMFKTDEDIAYVQKIGKNKEKIDSDVSDITCAQDDFSTFYYLKEDNLYKKTIGKDKEKLAKNVVDILTVYESGEIYFVRSETSTRKLEDDFDDDLKASDANIVEPQVPDYDGSWDEYELAYEQYREDYVEYLDKKARDDIREEVNDYTYETTEYSLLYFSNGKETVLSNCFDYQNYDYQYSYDRPVLIFTEIEKANKEKVKMSEISDFYELLDAVRSNSNSSSTVNIALKEAVTKIGDEGVFAYFINEDGNIVYYMDEQIETEDEEPTASLYKISVSKDRVSKAELYDEDISVEGAGFISNTSFVYYKNCKTVGSSYSYKGDMYIDKQLIDYDVLIYSIRTHEETVYYFTDWNDEKEYATLKMFEDGEKIKIADDVHSFSINSNNEVLYLSDYNTTRSKGELYRYSDDKFEKIDDDVICIIEVYDY